MDWIKQNIPPSVQYGVLAVGIIALAYFLWLSFTPSDTQALVKAKPIFSILVEGLIVFTPLSSSTH